MPVQLDRDCGIRSSPSEGSSEVGVRSSIHQKIREKLKQRAVSAASTSGDALQKHLTTNYSVESTILGMQGMCNLLKTQFFLKVLLKVFVIFFTVFSWRREKHYALRMMRPVTAHPEYNCSVQA